MQNLTKLIAEKRKKTHTAEQDILNLIREYLQVLILKGIYQSKYGAGLSFIGGTCLRICYNMKRYSEDLDFTLDRNILKYSFGELNNIIASFLKNTDFEVDLNISEDKIVQKSFIRVNKVMHAFGISPLKSQKLHVKIEIDTNPVKVTDHEIETYFVTKFDENFPILKHTDETLFAGKICALLNRSYTKGRDFYDLIWYLNRNTKINLEYINRSFKQARMTLQFENQAEVIEALSKRVGEVKKNEIMKDIGRFIEDPLDKRWIDIYPAVFKQASEKFLAQ